MSYELLTTGDLKGLEKRFEMLEQSVRAFSPLYVGDILSDNDLCKMLNVSKRTTFNWRSDRKISYSQVGKNIFYTREDVDRFLAIHKHQAIA